MQKTGMNYRVLMGHARTAYRYGNVDSLPVTILIGKQPRVAPIHLGLVSKKGRSGDPETPRVGPRL